LQPTAALAMPGFRPTRTSAARERELTGIDIACLVQFAAALPSIPNEVLMRLMALAILAIVSVSAAGPARAQKYDPNFPFCMHVVEWGGSPHEDCSYTTMAQCRASAAGLGFTCDPNPYYAGARAAPGRYDRRHRRLD